MWGKTWFQQKYSFLITPSLYILNLIISLIKRRLISYIKMKQNRTGISIVIPIYNEELTILPLYKEILNSVKSINLEFELILVDDRSSDGSWSKIVYLCNKDKRLKGLRLSKNFGHQYALLAGISYSKGSAIITMDADLQHPPSLIPKLIDEWKKGFKIVNTLRIDTNTTPFFKRKTSKFFYKVFSFLSGTKLHEGMADFRLLDRQVADEILSMEENGLFIRGLINWVGYSHTTIQFNVVERKFGKSKYTFGKMVHFAWIGITAFSIKPLKLGILVSLITAILAFYQIIDALWAYFNHETVPGWTTIIVLQSFLFCILFFLLGIIGEYLGRVLIEIRKRPRFIIDEAVGFLEYEKKMLESESI